MTSSLAQRRTARALSVALEHPAAVYVAGLAPGSRRTQIGALKIAALFFGGDVATCRWTSLGFAHINALRGWLSENYAPSSANRILSAVRGVLRTAVKLEQLDHGAMVRAVDVGRVRGTREPSGRALSRDELARLFQVAATARDRALLALAYGGGLRRAELAALEIIHYRDRSLTVKGKGGKIRIVPLPMRALSLLDEWIAVRPRDLSGSLFGIGADALYALFRRLARAAGVAHFSPHDIRRSYIGDLFDRGVDIATIQDLAGHASPKTSSGYDRRGMRARRAAADALDLPF